MRFLKTAVFGLLTFALSNAQIPRLLSQPGPTFVVSDESLPNPLTFIAYGDQRFTDPANTEATDPRIRKWLVDQIAAEQPAAVILNADVPLAGNLMNDYSV